MQTTGTGELPPRTPHHWSHREEGLFSSPYCDFDMRGYSDFPDYIGVESCADMRADALDVPEDSGDIRTRGRRKKDHGISKNGHKEYPPLIPLLARTENLQSHMPWVLKRQYTPDGRLVLTEEKVRHHEYFLAHRLNGRLTLQLIPLDDASLYPPNQQCHDEYHNEDECEIQRSQSPSPSPLALDHDDFDNLEKDGEGEGVKRAESTNTVSNSGGGSKCLNFTDVGVGGSPSSPCIFGVPLLALRPVRS